MRGHTERTPEKVAQTIAMRAEGKTWREIGETFGVSTQTAHEWGTDPDAAKRHARKASYAGTCEDCGAPTGGDVGPGGRRFCFGCGSRHGGQVTGVIQRARVADRRARIVEMWHAGESLNAIAADLDMTVSALGRVMVAMRRQGYDLPYRYRVENGRRVPA